MEKGHTGRLRLPLGRHFLRPVLNVPSHKTLGMQAQIEVQHRCPTTCKKVGSCCCRLRSYKHSNMAVTVGDICKIILAVILPPLGVFAEKERCDKDVLINILLTVLGFLPGKPHP